MPLYQSGIPVIPYRPRVLSFAGRIHRSYSFGRQNYLRACQGQVLTLTVSIEGFSVPCLLNLVTTMDSSDGKTWQKIPFAPVSTGTFICQVAATKTGFHSFRAEFSLDQGISWIRDTVDDSWILVDPPQTDALRVYTIIPNISGTIADWRNDLERIRSMDFNAIHLLPLTTMDTSESPYSARDLFHVDPRYLLPDHDELSQLEDFVETAKSLQMKLCFDLVLNHVGIHSNIARQAPDWIVPDAHQPDGFQRARYLTDQGWNFWGDLILINYNHPVESIRAEIWSYMANYALFWAKYADATGGFVRFDNLHSSNQAFIQYLTEALHRIFPGVGILAEYFTDDATLIRTTQQWGLNLNLATPWDYKFVPKLREYLKGIHKRSKSLKFFMPVSSHDSGSPAQEFGSVDSTVPRYVAAALLGTGATGMVQGVEYGIERKIDFIGKRPKMEFPPQGRFADFIRKVNSILAGNPAFRQGSCVFVDNNHPAILAAFRKDLENGGFLVICNFDIHSSQNITIDLKHFLGEISRVTCYDLLNNESLEFFGAKIQVHLQACSAKVLKF